MIIDRRNQQQITDDEYFSAYNIHLDHNVKKPTADLLKVLLKVTY
jgi:hypothetical protein